MENRSRVLDPPNKYRIKNYFSSCIYLSVTARHAHRPRTKFVLFGGYLSVCGMCCRYSTDLSTLTKRISPAFPALHFARLSGGIWRIFVQIKCYPMVLIKDDTQNMLRHYERKQVFSEESISFTTAFDLFKYLKENITCATISELPSNIRSKCSQSSEHQNTMKNILTIQKIFVSLQFHTILECLKGAFSSKHILF